MRRLRRCWKSKTAGNRGLSQNAQSQNALKMPCLTLNGGESAQQTQEDRGGLTVAPVFAK